MTVCSTVRPGVVTVRTTVTGGVALWPDFRVASRAASQPGREQQDDERRDPDPPLPLRWGRPRFDAGRLEERGRPGRIVECTVQVADELRRSRIPGRGVLRERAFEDAIELARQPWVGVRGRGDRRVDVGERLGRRRVGGERAPPGEELPRDDGEPVAVARRSRPRARRLLR